MVSILQDSEREAERIANLHFRQWSFSNENLRVFFFKDQDCIIAPS